MNDIKLETMRDEFSPTAWFIMRCYIPLASLWDFSLNQELPQENDWQFSKNLIVLIRASAENFPPMLQQVSCTHSSGTWSLSCLINYHLVEGETDPLPTLPYTSVSQWEPLSNLRRLTPLISFPQLLSNHFWHMCVCFFFCHFQLIIISMNHT